MVLLPLWRQGCRDSRGPRLPLRRRSCPPILTDPTEPGSRTGCCDARAAGVRAECPTCPCPAHRQAPRPRRRRPRGARQGSRVRARVSGRAEFCAAKTERQGTPRRVATPAAPARAARGRARVSASPLPAAPRSRPGCTHDALQCVRARVDDATDLRVRGVQRGRHARREITGQERRGPEAWSERRAVGATRGPAAFAPAHLLGTDRCALPRGIFRAGPRSP